MAIAAGTGRIARTALLALCTTLALAATPVVVQARVALQVGGATLTVTGGDGEDQPSLSYEEPADDVSPGYTRVQDAGGVLDPLPPTCERAEPGSGFSATVAYCEDGGSAPLLETLELVLGGGGDLPRIDECFDRVRLDAGEGHNSVRVPECAAGVLTWTSGGGHDAIYAVDSAVDVTATLGDGDDDFTGGDGTSVVHGGAGGDRLVGGAGSDRLHGDDGDDRLAGHAGDDDLDGGAGADRLGVDADDARDADPGADVLRGGPDRDTLDLSARAAGVTITLDGIADDGSPGERDNAGPDIEQVTGTPYADVITGSAAADSLIGLAGDDRLNGDGGPDDLNGGDGDDTLSGGADKDWLKGDSGNDTLHGGAGTDQLFGERQICTSPGCTPGNDVLYARDGEVDAVVCGGGQDTTQVDALDQVQIDGATGCETVDRTPLPAGLFAAPPPQKGSFGFTTLKPRTVAKGARVTVTCPASCTFTASLVLSAANARRFGMGDKQIIVARAAASLPAAGQKTVRLRMSVKTRRKLRRARTVPMVVKVRGRGVNVRLATRTQAIRLRPR